MASCLLLAAPPTPLLLPATVGRRLALDTVVCADLFALCDGLPDQSIDLILADLPYGTTACEWDEVIPFEPMWAAFKRVIKPRGAIVLTASQPFTSRLVMSNFEQFKYAWVWDKVFGVGFVNVSRKPLVQHEDVLVFGNGPIHYYPVMAKGEPYSRPQGKNKPTVYNGVAKHDFKTVNNGERFPKTILTYSSASQAGVVHPTQKPVALFEYLIRTYTRPGEVVLDPVCGSGTTAIACRNTGRHYICGDKEPAYVKIAQDRLNAPYTLPLPLDPPAPRAEQATLFDRLTND